MSLAELSPASPEAQFWPETRARCWSCRGIPPAGSLLQASLTGSLSLAESARGARTLAQEVRARQRLACERSW